MVGKGKVHNTLGDLLPHKLLPSGFLKASIDIALEGDVLLPISNDISDATLVGDAIGSYVAWPKNLICIDDETPTKPKSTDKRTTRHNESVASNEEIPAQGLQ